MNRMTIAALVAFAAVTFAAGAASAAALRGEIAAITKDSVQVRLADGKLATAKLPADLNVVFVRPIAMDAVTPNSFIGTAAVGAPGGALKALEVVVFPEAMRGRGEGHRPYDLLPESTMTNGTVTAVVAANKSRELTATAKGETFKILVPEGTPVVTIDPADAKALTVGAKVYVPYDEAGGALTARFVAVGKDGFKPPM